MLCPKCNQDNDKVIDSRASEGNAAIRRRRMCLACDHRFTTYERAEKIARLMVEKRDGRRMPLDAQKILRSIQAACGKRPVSEDAKEQMVREIDEDLHREFEREVSSWEIGRRVAAALRGVDHIAYIRFASELFQFQSLEDLSKELDELQSRPKPLRNENGLFDQESAAQTAPATSKHE